jgi:lipoprotein-releasing system ATP-binding protein
MLEAANIFKSYGQIPVLKGVSMGVKLGEVVSIIGPSGAGKSTLLQLLGTLDTPDQGTITLAGERVSSLRGNALAVFRNRHIGFVFQSHNLLPEFTALENVCIPAYIAKASKANAEKHATEILANLGLADRLFHKPMMLSGGEQQRVAVARALINGPSIVFADEPSGNLDAGNAEDLHNLFFKLRSELNLSFVIVTHNQQLALRADRCLVMKDGLMNEASVN